MMHSTLWRRLLWPTSLLPALALAQSPGPSDPDAPAPALSYSSVLAGPSRGVEPGSADWRQLNAEVGRFPRGHADILKWEQAQPQTPSPAAAPAPRPPSAGTPHLHGGQP